MIIFGLLLAGGVSAFAFKNLQSKRNLIITNKKKSSLVSSNKINNNGYDDIKEIRHSYKSSLYAISLVSAGSLFYPPIILAGLPILGYGVFNFFLALKKSKEKEIQSPMVVFEIVSIFASLLTKHFFYSALLLLLAFLRRDFLLKTGNLLSYYSSLDNTVPQNVWIIRDNAELEMNIRDLQSSDIIVGRSGEVILIEGEIIEGEAQIKQFCLERRMKVFHKAIGDRVHPFTSIDSGCIHIKIICSDWSKVPC